MDDEPGFPRFPYTYIYFRLGVYEIIYCDDVDDDITVSECVKLASDYAYEDDISFINGILGSIVRARNAEKASAPAEAD